MKTEIRARRIPLTESFRRQVETRLDAALDRFAHAVTHARVRFADLNGPRGGIDKRCQVSLDLRGGGQVHVEAEAERIDVALADAVARAALVLSRQLARAMRPARVRPRLAFQTL